MKMKLMRQLKHDKKDIGTRLDQKIRYRSSIEKLKHSVLIEKTYAQNIYQK
jgi:hypothetical protein